jgi:hypothetical protein
MTYKPLNWSIEGLCRCLEWSHRRAFSASIKNLKEVDLGEERATLEEIRSLKKFGNRVKITHCMVRFQEWFDIYVNDKQVADAYVDHEAFVGKASWNIWREEFDDVIKNTSVFQMFTYGGSEKL